MKAFDSDVLSDLLRGRADYWARLIAIPFLEQSVPVVVVEEVIRGRLDVIRQAQAGKANVPITEAYSLFERTFADLRTQRLLAYDETANEVFRDWRTRGIRTPTNDLRIAATCVAHQATLVSRNRKDFEGLSGLSVEFWE